ncbi:MAG: Clp protease N-terminal domain-containing protein [Dermatophilaceae bacterium]
MFERFTQSARGAVMAAREEADRRGDGWIGTEHVVLALAEDDAVSEAVLLDAGVTAEVLRAAMVPGAPGARGDLDADALRTIGIDLQDVRRAVERTFGEGALDELPVPPARRRSRHIPFTTGAKKALELAVRQAATLSGGSIGSEHLLLGVLDEGGAGAHLLTSVGVDPQQLRATTVDKARRSA